MFAALLLAVACTPVDPTPCVNWDQAAPAGGPGVAATKVYRVEWKYSDDTTWRGSTDLPLRHENTDDFAIYPGRDFPFPIQRAYPNDVQAKLVNIRVTAVAADGTKAVPSNVYTECAPRLCLPPWHGCN